MKDFFSDRKQRVVLNGHSSSWIDVQAELPQGSVLGPLTNFKSKVVRWGHIIIFYSNRSKSYGKSDQ